MSSLEVVTTSPPNAGVRLPNLDGRTLSQAEMYVRCNFEIPPTPEGFDLSVPDSPVRFITPADLAHFPQKCQTVVMECAGNGRTFMDPQPDGTPWTLGGVSPITVRGVQLKLLLGDLPDDIEEVVLTGADSGVVEPEGHINYQFSIDRQTALSDSPLLVTHIGGLPLTPQHGAPVRLVVPGHYAMMSVKWLTSVEVTRDMFQGHFVNKYRFFGDTTEPPGGRVGPIDVRSVIAKPTEGVMLNPGETTVAGSAWSGRGHITAVDISTDAGETWTEAGFSETAEPWAPVQWSADVELTPGIATIVARAHDSGGNTQPMSPRWNANGYANNVTHRVEVTVS